MLQKFNCLLFNHDSVLVKKMVKFLKAVDFSQKSLAGALTKTSMTLVLSILLNGKRLESMLIIASGLFRENCISLERFNLLEV